MTDELPEENLLDDADLPTCTCGDALDDHEPFPETEVPGGPCTVEDCDCEGFEAEDADDEELAESDRLFVGELMKDGED
jgi:hypothetical protein